MGGHVGKWQKNKICLSFPVPLFLSPPKKTRSEFLLVIYYASLGVVNCSSTWKTPFFSLVMIADHAEPISSFGWVVLLWLKWQQIQQHNWATPKSLCSTMELLSPLLKRGTQVWKDCGGNGQLHLLNAWINFNGQGCSHDFVCPYRMSTYIHTCA